MCAFGATDPAAGCDFSFVMGTTSYAVPNLALPRKGVIFADPTFHTYLVRMTDKAIDGYLGPGIENEYAKADPENSDGTLLILRGNAGAWYLYSPFTYRKLRRLSAFDACGQEPEPRWDREDRSVFFYLCNARLRRYDTDTGRSTAVHDFAADVAGAAYVTTGSEGDASLDRQYWCFMVKDARWRLLSVLVYDRAANRVVGQKRTGFPDSLNWVGMDTSGTHCVVGYDSLSYTQVFSRNFRTRLNLPAGSNAHGDVALTRDGRDVFVYQNNATDYIAMADLVTGAETPLVRIPFQVNVDIGLHISGNAAVTPGWALVSTFGSKRPPAGSRRSWMDTQLFMLELKRSPRIWRIAHTQSYTSLDYSGEQNYFAEAFAAINTRGTRIYFGSNWGRFPPAVPADYTETYAVILPDNWVTCLPK